VEEEMSTIARHWRISTVRKGWTGGGPWDLGCRELTEQEAKQEARRLNEAHPEYQHEPVHVTWPRKRS
jgi:hypothetical protein